LPPPDGYDTFLNGPEKGGMRPGGEKKIKKKEITVRLGVEWGRTLVMRRAYKPPTTSKPTTRVASRRLELFDSLTFRIHLLVSSLLKHETHLVSFSK
jgi:hypothetical protein